MALADIQSIVIVIMENRSFDHMLGYLSLSSTANQLALEGLQSDPAWQAAHANRQNGRSFSCHRLAPDIQSIADPQHDQLSIAMQIGTPAVGPGAPQMGGFVESYVRFSSAPPTDPSAVMGYYDQAALPVFDFFARHYCVCDHWFAALPLGTQANRLMAMAGESRLIDNSEAFLPVQPLVYDWLNERKVNWCAYQSGDFLPFFSLMASWLPEIGTSLTLSSFGGRGHFRRYDNLKSEWLSDASMPSVIFIEPEYTDGPHATPNDDHPPTGTARGQAFLADVYRTLTANAERWSKTMLIVTYDEHGGFFDHIPPLPIATTIAGQKIPTTGIRVPGFVISPYARPGVFSGQLDHTSILQLFDDRFGSGPGYSLAVNQRQASLDRLSNTLLAAPTIMPAPGMSGAPAINVRETVTAPPRAPDTANARALHAAARKLADEHPDLVAQPGWEKLRQYLSAPIVESR